MKRGNDNEMLMIAFHKLVHRDSKNNRLYHLTFYYKSYYDSFKCNYSLTSKFKTFLKTFG
jgi:hypothetical protein